jgi:hypothetical protein
VCTRNRVLGRSPIQEVHNILKLNAGKEKCRKCMDWMRKRGKMFKIYKLNLESSPKPPIRDILRLNLGFKSMQRMNGLM